VKTTESRSHIKKKLNAGANVDQRLIGRMRQDTFC
jgi:hypothetical protein